MRQREKRQRKKAERKGLENNFINQTIIKIAKHPGQGRHNILSVTVTWAYDMGSGVFKLPYQTLNSIRGVQTFSYLLPFVVTVINPLLFMEGSSYSEEATATWQGVQ